MADISWRPCRTPVNLTCTSLWHNVSMALNPLQGYLIFVASPYETRVLMWPLKFWKFCVPLQQYVTTLNLNTASKSKSYS